MNLRLVLSPLAEQDVAEHYLRIALDNPAAADRFFEAAWQSFEFLAQFPKVGKAFQPLFVRLRGLRTWRVSGFPNYLIFYTYTSRALDIRRVVHGAMDLEAELRRSNH